MSKTKKETKTKAVEMDRNDIQSEQLVKDYLKELGSIKSAFKTRKQLMNMMFWEYENYNTHMFEDRDAKIYKIISEKQTYQNSFLGSSLGFNKTNMENKYLEILHKFRLEKKPQSPSPRNCLEFEKLKLLLIKLFEFVSSSKNSYKKK